MICVPKRALVVLTKALARLTNSTPTMVCRPPRMPKVTSQPPHRPPHPPCDCQGSRHHPSCTPTIVTSRSSWPAQQGLTPSKISPLGLLWKQGAAAQGAVAQWGRSLHNFPPGVRTLLASHAPGHLATNPTPIIPSCRAPIKKLHINLE
jgi:hypothetical protein